LWAASTEKLFAGKIIPAFFLYLLIFN